MGLLDPLSSNTVGWRFWNSFSSQEQFVYKFGRHVFASWKKNWPFVATPTRSPSILGRASVSMIVPPRHGVWQSHSWNVRQNRGSNPGPRKQGISRDSSNSSQGDSTDSFVAWVCWRLGWLVVPGYCYQYLFSGPQRIRAVVNELHGKKEGLLVA